ncbi:MAG TPA: hypothetical protein VK530_03980 [Candidatus Acidoferrum sp.]|nr:hypothetical protein [Candidatus Acidoferrum sp.]
MKTFSILLAIIGALVEFSARAQSYSIDWFTIDGGGGTSTGGVYSVSGTIGQPDAGTLTNGPYSLVGGFWGGVNVIQTPGAPLLSVEKLVGGNVRVFWPLPANGFVLDQTTALTSTPAATVWNQVPFPYQTNATHISITVTPSGVLFYRLRHP